MGSKEKISNCQRKKNVSKKILQDVMYTQQFPIRVKEKSFLVRVPYWEN